MATVSLTRSDFENVVIGNDTVLVDFWAAWCGPCRAFAPVYEAASERHPDVVFGKVDTEAEAELAGWAGIRSIPTLMAFRGGVPVFSQAGALPAAALEQLIASVLALDMAEVRAQVDRVRTLQDLPREVGQAAFAAACASGATTIDVREPEEYRAGHVPGAVLMPLGQVVDRAAQLPTDAAVYVICASGNRSLNATDALRRLGIEAYSVAGGTTAWARAGREIVADRQVTAPPPRL